MSNTMEADFCVTALEEAIARHGNPIHLSQAAKLSHQAGPPQADVAAFIEAHDENPKPYLWVKSANEILAVVKRFCQRTEQALYGEL